MNDPLPSLKDYCWRALEQGTKSNWMAPVELRSGQQQEAAVTLGRSQETVNIKWGVAGKEYTFSVDFSWVNRGQKE